MALVQAICTSYNRELLEAVHNFSVAGGSTFNLALFRNAAAIVGSFGSATTNYSEMGADEVVGTGYVAGGLPLVNAGTGSGNPGSGVVAFADFDDLAFSPVTLVTSGALIYNTASGQAVLVLDFGSDKIATVNTFTIEFPIADAANAIVRISS